MPYLKTSNSVNACSAQACLEGESVVNHSYGSLCAEEEGSDAFGPSGDECGDEFEDRGLGVELESHEYFGDNFYDNWEERAVDGIVELGCINLKEITAICMRMNGFAVRKNKFRQNMKNEGFRDMGSINNSLRQKLEPKAKTRCGCEAEMRIHLHSKSGRWIVLYFQKVHNHEFLEDRLTCMLSGHRKMDPTAVKQMNMMLKSWD
ncbi:hypothetical protein Ahy_A09g043172 [Arachis hypogaea]|uniref:FAR1 domain-containing protein n=1 Tax=Arachis hypogaea TaxID=3818 RepID=A0A445BHP4_ARAHY|nr:hypothetical protein Ahy_A09g043172 [Arachis hypogaea]